VAKLTSRLDHKQKDRVSYFQAKTRDKRYTDHNFDYVLSQEREMNLDSFHDLRHTHATLLLKAGAHPKIVSKR
jgi:integrase